MNRKDLHKKINSMIEGLTFDNMLEQINNIEYQLMQMQTKTDKVIIPTKANFQLPNQFLCLKPNATMDALFTNSNHLKINNEKIDEVIEYLDEIDVDSSFTTQTNNKNAQTNIEKMMNSYFNGI